MLGLCYPAPVLTGKQAAGLCALFFCVGGGVGYLAGVLSVKGARELVSGWFESERHAEVSSPTALDRPGFSLKFPANWKLRSDDEDFDPDHMFSIDSPGSSFVMVIVAEGDLEPKDSVREHVTIQTSKLIKNARQMPFSRWGTFTGEGVLLAGNYLGLEPGTMRIFSWRTTGRTFTIVESTYDDDRARVAPGFALIERSFKVTN